MKDVAVCGTGHVGLVTAACLASLGNDVRCYDKDGVKIAALQRGQSLFFEPQLDDVVAHGVASGRLQFFQSASEALTGCSIVFIAVGTPVGAAGEADLTCVRDAVREIARWAPEGTVVVNKSTVPVETADLVARLFSKLGRTGFSVASNPEFLREGSAVDDFMHPDRIVIGTSDERARRELQALYALLDAPVFCVDVRTAEMIKYAANSFLATKISFVNELANLCDAVGADIDDVVRGIAADPRIGAAFLTPGLGFGGSCLPKDVSALSYVARAHGIEALLLDAVLSVNRRQVCRAVFTLEAELGDLDGRSVALLGAAFKGGTDDVRESPAVSLAKLLAGKGARVTVSDPAALENASRELPAVARNASPVAACEGADAVVVATDWPAFRTLEWSAVAARMRGTFVLDCRNALDPQSVRAAGLDYRGLGRPHGVRERVA
jgi:UDPglucose 6-dehydrogenase